MNPNKTLSSPKILLRSSWQYINIGDVAHTPGALAVIEKNIPEAEVILWASSNLTYQAAHMLQKRFPKVKIVTGKIRKDGRGENEELDKALKWCDMLLHGSASALGARDDVRSFLDYVKKPYGVFGITYGGIVEKELLDRASFIFFRDPLSLEKAKADGIECPIMEFGPDGAFGTDLANDRSAEYFLSDNDLEEGKFMCCIPRLRYTPYWKISTAPYSKEKDERNIEMKEHDHAPLREAIISVVKETGMKILVCPEDSSQMAVGKEMIVDKLPEDIKKNVVWREKFWLPDEALSIYRKSAGLFGNEMHSPIMCIANGIPAVVCRFAEQTTKGYMWRTIGLGEWLFDLDIPEEVANIAPTVLSVAKDPKAAKQKAEKAREFVIKRQEYMCEVLKNTLDRIK